MQQLPIAVEFSLESSFEQSQPYIRSAHLESRLQVSSPLVSLSLFLTSILYPCIPSHSMKISEEGTLSGSCIPESDIRRYDNTSVNAGPG